MPGRKARKVVPLTEEEKKVIEENLPLIWWEIRRQRPKSDHQAAEWVQEGVFGAVKAIRSYSSDKGALSNWLVFHVRAAVWSFRREKEYLITLPSVLLTEENKRLAEQSQQVVSLQKVCKGKGFDVAEEQDRECDEHLFRALECLDDKDFELVKRRFFLGDALQTIADSLGVSHQRVAQRLSKALVKIKQEYCRLEDLPFTELPRRRKHEKRCAVG